jgi:DNA invertase Pin-like site-specific DNA recombinase
MIAAIYARQSKDRTGNELAVSRQLDDCRAICATRGWAAVEFIENNVSASKGRRPVYESMMSDIQAGKIGAVVAWDADRLTRQPRELEDFIDLADRHGLALATVGGDFDLSTPTGRGNARMRGVFARMEMEQKSARQKRQRSNTRRVVGDGADAGHSDTPAATIRLSRPSPNSSARRTRRFSRDNLCIPLQHNGIM